MPETYETFPSKTMFGSIRNTESKYPSAQRHIYYCPSEEKARKEQDIKIEKLKEERERERETWRQIK